MQLKVQGIANDPVRRMATIMFVDILDDLPQISATIRSITNADQTQAEVHAVLKHQIRELFEEAIRGMERFSD
jgi:hypothetical protein